MDPWVLESLDGPLCDLGRRSGSAVRDLMDLDEGLPWALLPEGCHLKYPAGGFPPVPCADSELRFFRCPGGSHRRARFRLGCDVLVGGSSGVMKDPSEVEKRVSFTRHSCRCHAFPKWFVNIWRLLPPKEYSNKDRHESQRLG